MIHSGTLVYVYQQNYGKVGEYILTSLDISRGYFEFPCWCSETDHPGKFELPDGELELCVECKGQKSRIIPLF